MLKCYATKRVGYSVLIGGDSQVDSIMFVRQEALLTSVTSPNHKLCRMRVTFQKEYRFELRFYLSYMMWMLGRELLYR